MSVTEKIAGYEIHPAAAVLPLMADSELEELGADIKKNGQRHPVITHEGKVIDGRNRLLACVRAGVAPLVAEWRRSADVYGNRVSVLDFIISENVARRHLTPSQKAMVAAELVPFFEAEAKARQVGSLKKGDEKPVRADRPERDNGTAAAAAAKAVGSAERSVKRAKAVAERAPDVAAEVVKGEVSLFKGEEISKLPAEKRPEAIEQAKRNPRQVAPRHKENAEDDNDVRFTPRRLIEELHQEHDFTIDAASDPSSPAAQVIGKHWTKEDDGLEESWRGQRVFCNPPFSAIPDWVKKAHDEAPLAELIVMLLPATRTEQPFWHRYIEPFRDGRDASYVKLETRFLEARTRFGSPRDPEGVASGSPPFGCVLVTWRNDGHEASGKGRKGAAKGSADSGAGRDVRVLRGEGTALPDNHEGDPGDPLLQLQRGRRAQRRDLPAQADAVGGAAKLGAGAVQSARKGKREAAPRVDEPDPAPLVSHREDFLWRGGIARAARQHAYVLSNPGSGLCGAVLGSAKAERPGGAICATCEQLVGAPFFKASLEAYRKGKDVCPWCGVDRREGNWISSGMLDDRYGLSTCGTCSTKGRRRIYVGQEHRDAWVAAKGAKPKLSRYTPTAEEELEAGALRLKGSKLNPGPEVYALSEFKRKANLLAFSVRPLKANGPRERFGMLRATCYDCKEQVDFEKTAHGDVRAKVFEQLDRHFSRCRGAKRTGARR